MRMSDRLVPQGTLGISKILEYLSVYVGNKPIVSANDINYL